METNCVEPAVPSLEFRPDLVRQKYLQKRRTLWSDDGEPLQRCFSAAGERLCTAAGCGQPAYVHRRLAAR